METAIGLVLILHFIGLASLLGGVMSQMTAPVKTITRSIVDGAWTMLATGILLIGLVSANPDEEDPVNHMKFGVKGLILAVIISLVLQGKRKESVEKATFFSIGALAIANIAIAVLWA
jgi:hypothetical protein